MRATQHIGGTSRMPWRLAVITAMSVTSLVGTDSVEAQINYRCVENGRYVYADRPCGGVSSDRLVQYGPQPDRNITSGTYTRPTQRVPDHHRYLSAECARLNDAIRTGPAQSLRPERMAELHDEYRRQCSEDDMAARQALSREMAERSAQRRTDQQIALSKEADRRRERAQCDEMLTTLHARRQRVDALNPGQKAELDRFVSLYNERCGAGVR